MKTTDLSSSLKANIGNEKIINNYELPMLSTTLFSYLFWVVMNRRS